MKKGRYTKRRLFIGLLLSIAIVFVMGVPLLAATSEDSTVTATPAYIEITNSPNTWVLNGITGDSKIDTSTTYYANPLGDTTAPGATVVNGECRFTLTNSVNSTVAVDLDVNLSDFTGGDANMTNSNLGSNGATSFGAYSWYSGMTYSLKVIMKSSASDEFYTNLATNTSIKWGAEVLTQTDAWTGGTSSTATMTITATKS